MCSQMQLWPFLSFSIFLKKTVIYLFTLFNLKGYVQIMKF